MGKADRYLTAQDIFNRVHGEHGTAADATPPVLLVGGKYTAWPANSAVDSEDAAILWLSAEGYAHPYQHDLQLVTVTNGSANSTSAFSGGLGVFQEADLIVWVSLATGTSPTLDLLIDGRYNGTAINIAHLSQITGTTQVGVHLSKRQASGQVLASNVDAGAGTFRAMGWGDGLRVRSQIGGTAGTFSYEVRTHFTV